MKHLIVNADDFGLSKEVNSAVEIAHREGVLTSASLMIAEKGTTEAISVARNNPDLGVGLHLSLVQGKPVLPIAEIASIVTTSGCFFSNPVTAGMRFFFLRKCRDALRNEIEAQIEKFLDTGLVPTHLDGHLNIHLHPSVFLLLLPLLEKYDIRAIRVPAEPLLFHLSTDRSNAFFKIVHSIIFGILGKKAKKRLDILGISYPDNTFGLLQSGNMNKDFVKSALSNLRDGFTEMSFHIALKQLPRGVGAEGYSYREELKVLINPEVNELIKRKNIHLANYRTLLKIKQQKKGQVVDFNNSGTIK